MCKIYWQKTNIVSIPPLFLGGRLFPNFEKGLEKNECLGELVHSTDICLGTYCISCQKKTAKLNMALRTQFSMLILVQPPINQLHCTKNHISYVLEYHEKFKIPRKYKLFINFLDKKDRFSYLWKVQNKNFSVLKKHGIPCWRKYNLTPTFWIKRRPYFPSPKSLKEELFCIQKTQYSMLKKISSYINFLNQKKIVFPISKKFKTRTFP